MIAHASANKEFLCSLPKEEWYVYFFVFFLLFLTRVSWHIGGGIASTSLLSIPFSIIVQWFCSLCSFLFSLSSTSNSHCHWALGENWCAFIFKLLGDLFQLSEDTALASYNWQWPFFLNHNFIRLISISKISKTWLKTENLISYTVILNSRVKFEILPSHNRSIPRMYSGEADHYDFQKYDWDTCNFTQCNDKPT